MKNTVQLSLLLSIGLLLLSVPAFAKPGIPAVHSISIQQDNIVFNVTSFGWSQDADFELKVEDGQRITLYRTRPDLCKRAPMVIQIKRSLQEAGLSMQRPFSVINPFSPPPVKRKGKPEKYPSKGKAGYK